MLEIEAMTKITALDNGALKSLSQHCFSCNLDQHGGACFYPNCKGSKRLMIKNAMSGAEKGLSLIHIVKRCQKDSSRRDDESTSSTTTITRNGGGAGGGGSSSASSSFCSSWKSRSRVQADISMQDEEGQMPPRK